MLRAVFFVVVLTSTALVPLFDHANIPLATTNASVLQIPQPINVSYYPVTEVTADSLRQAILKVGPVDVLGIRRAAVFSWKINWYWAELGEGKINLADSNFQVEYFLTLPQILGKELDQKDSQRWNYYLNALISHELRHYLNADQCAGEMGLQLERMARDSKIADKLQVISAMRAVLKDCSRRDLVYDSQTKHGQNASLQ